MWEQIHDSRQIYFKDEDTLDENIQPEMDDDEDLMMYSRNKKMDKGFGYANYNGYASKSPVVREDHELNNILENRHHMMKQGVTNARIQINRNPVKTPKTEDELVVDNEDEDLAHTLKFRNDDQKSKNNKQYELRPLNGDDEFEGMDGGPAKKDPLSFQASKPPLIPNAKNRVKLQPMSLGPII